MIAVDLTAPTKRILEAADQLRLKWIDTVPHWNDGNARNIEATYLEPLARDINGALQAVRQMQEVLRQMGHECDPET